jgi:catechol 2,3-dioxygenase-like lactoylglutathione lyase family enzyme
MKRFHVHVTVDDLETNIRFYSAVFGSPPTVAKSDYAKWMIEEPRLNFSISNRGAKTGLDHLGFQVDSDEELDELRQKVAEAEIAALDQPQSECCYALSDTGSQTRRALPGKPIVHLAQSKFMGRKCPKPQNRPHAAPPNLNARTAAKDHDQSYI